MEKEIYNIFSEERFAELLDIVGIPAWSWDIVRDCITYNKSWSKLFGIDINNDVFSVNRWENAIFPDDLQYFKSCLTAHLEGTAPYYEAEYRVKLSSGKIIWCQDHGKIISTSDNGVPLKMVGVIQDLSKIKHYEESLKMNEERLNMAIQVADLGSYIWDMVNNTIDYGEEYLNLLGYLQEDFGGTITIETWSELTHPDDLPRAFFCLEEHFKGNTPAYNCELRMRKKDGSYLWMKGFGKVIKRDKDGNPILFVGAHQDIHYLKKALEENERYSKHLEREVKTHTDSIIKQDRMLMTVNEIANRLISYGNEPFDDVIYSCLEIIGRATKQNRVYIWKDVIDENGVLCCVHVYEWVKGTSKQIDNPDLYYVPYMNLPAFKNTIETGECLNSFISHMSKSEQEVLAPQDIKSILIAPINISGKNWGFVGIDNCKNEKLFTKAEESMLIMSGFLLANAINKKNTEDILRDADERAQVMLNSTPLGCNFWNKDFQNIDCNDEVARLFDLKDKAEYMSRFYELSPEFQPNGELSSELSHYYVMKAFETGFQKFEWMHKKPSGEPIPAEITLVRVRYKNDQIVVGYTRDLREEKAMLAAISQARDEAIANSKAKSDFLAKMSHEIRTPMNAISGMSELILRESVTNTIKEHAIAIKHASANLVSIINDILDLSKIESGKFEIISTQYSLASLINDIVSIIRIRVMEKPILFTVNIDAELPNDLIGDETRLRQILLNLLNNAVKYTEKGHVSLVIDGTITDNHTVELSIEISDTGIGIKNEDMSQLFGEFIQLDLIKHKAIEGTGLGLAIVKTFCKAMNGSISASSSYGEGSTFTVKLPQKFDTYHKFAFVKNAKDLNVLVYEPREVFANSIICSIDTLGVSCTLATNHDDFCKSLDEKSFSFIFVSSFLLERTRDIIKKRGLDVKLILLAEYGEVVVAPNVRTLSMPAHAISLANVFNGIEDDISYNENIDGIIDFNAPEARILIVDDIPTNLKVAEGLISPYKIKIDICDSGECSVRMVQSNHYDLIFMDHMMPGVDGVDATKQIRALSESEGDYFDKLPIVALTANAVIGVKEMFIKNGLNDFLAKPIEVQKLDDILKRYIPKEKQQQITQSGFQKQESDFSIEGVDVMSGLNRLGGSKEIYLKILQTYALDCEKKIDQLNQYIKDKDINLYTINVHGIKSASASIGAMQISEFAKELELAGKNGEMSYIETNNPQFLNELRTLVMNINDFFQKISFGRL